MDSGSTGKSRKKHGEGSWALRKTDPGDITFEDFKNPWTFSTIFMKDKDTVFQWLRENQLLASELPCRCGEIAILNKRSKTTDGYTFRCKSDHEMGMRKYSFF